MKSIDSRLKRSRAAKPKRPLNNNFTNTVMADIYTAASKQRRSAFQRGAATIRQYLTIPSLTKPAALGIAVGVVSLMAGTGYAALKWLQPHSTVDTNSTATLPNGNKRIWIHSDSCQGQDMEFPVKSYYEIKAGSKVTPEDLRKGVEASCEDDLLMQLFPEIQKESKAFSKFKPGDKQYFTPWIEIKEIDKESITVVSRVNGQDYPKAKLPFDKKARFYEKGQEMNPKQLKPGDWVTLVTYTTALNAPFSTETLRPHELEALMENGFPKGARVAGLIRHRYNPQNSMALMGVMGEDWTRLVEDKKSPGGWKQLVPFDHDWDKYKETFNE